MRNKQKQDFCVGCEKFIGPPQQAPPTVQATPQAQANTLPTKILGTQGQEPTPFSATSNDVIEQIRSFQLVLAQRLLETTSLGEQKEILENLLLSKQFLA